jgi:hypothetical protein
MKKVQRDELLDYQSYGEVRGEVREEIMRVKEARRVKLGEHLVFLFENADTMRYQVQEMMRAEQIVKEAAIREELDTYNSLLGDAGELACSLLISVEDPVQRKEMLAQWLPLPSHIYLELEDESRAYASYDRDQVGEDRLSAVQYLKFAVGAHRPVALGCDFAPLAGKVTFDSRQRTTLEADLQGD